MKKLMIVIFIFNFITGFFSCSNKFTDNNCTNVNKIDLLLRDVFRKKYIFPFLKNVGDTITINYNYLITKGFVLPDKTYFIRILNVENTEKIDSIKILPTTPDLLKDKMINTVFVSLKQFNADTTNATIEAGYSNMGKYALTSATFDYLYDSENCRWIVKDSTFWQY